MLPTTFTKSRLSLITTLAILAVGSPARPEATGGSSDLVRRETHASRKRLYRGNDLVLSFKNRLEMKLREGSGVRARGGRLVVDDAALAAGRQRPDAELALLAAVLNGPAHTLAVRMHTLPEAILAAMKEDGERTTGHELADLNLWFYVYVDGIDAAGLADVVNRLNALDLVELACPSPLPAPPPGTDPGAASTAWDEIVKNERAPWPGAEELRAIDEGILPSASDASQGRVAEAPAPLVAAGGSTDAPLNYEPQQDYGEAAPTGIDMDYLRSRYWGAWGDKSFYTDVEYNWNRLHVDLTDVASSTVYCNGVPSSSTNTPLYVEHGTAVLGMLSSDVNGSGTDGLVPWSQVKLSTEWPTTGSNRPGAVTQAAYQFTRGAVVILEMQAFAGFDCNGNGVLSYLDDLVPAEWQVAVKDAVRAATANGRIVVAAAGNGGCNLDQAGFGGAFSATDVTKDSWAIIVGNGQKTTRNTTAGSSFGARVDVQGEGDGQIVTCGYGTLYSADGQNAFYTNQFGGTSGATPAVAGACVALGSILKTHHGSVLDPRELRDLLRRDGTPQGTGGHIGPRPDLRKQVEHLVGRHLQIQSSDFDGDGRADYGQFRPATATWYIRYATGTTTTIAFGAKGDIPCPANVTGDARAELVVFRPTSGTFYVRRWDGTSFSAAIGQNGDIPVPLDYNGDGLAELALYRGVNVAAGLWRIRYESGTVVNVTFGLPGDTPLARDWNGNGKDDLLLYRGLPGAAATWYIRYDNGTSGTLAFGMGGDIPMTRKMGGRFHPVVWRPSNGTFYTYSMVTGATFTNPWGRPGDLPRMADTDRNGEDELIVYRPSTGVIWNAFTGNVTFGQVGDIPMTR